MPTNPRAKGSIFAAKPPTPGAAELGAGLPVDSPDRAPGGATPTARGFSCPARFRNFASGDRGTAVIEFAMLSPVFFALLLEVFQFGLYIYTSANLDYATTSVSRQILTGIIGNQNMNAQQFLTNVVCPKIGNSACASSVIVNLINLPASPSASEYLSLVNSSGTGLAPPPMDNTKTSFCPGFSGGINPTTGQAGVEVLEIFYPMPVFSVYWLNISTWSNNSRRRRSAEIEAAIFPSSLGSA